MKLSQLFREISHAMGLPADEESERLADTMLSAASLNRELSEEEVAELRPILMKRARKVLEMTPQERNQMLIQKNRNN